MEMGGDVILQANFLASSELFSQPSGQQGLALFARHLLNVTWHGISRQKVPQRRDNLPAPFDRYLEVGRAGNSVQLVQIIRQDPQVDQSFA
jgi:hypothetical protein